MSASAQAESDLVKQWVEAFNAFDLDGVSALYAEDCHYVVPAYGIDVVGRSAQRQVMESFRERLPDRQMKTQRMITADGVAAVEVEYVATSQGGDGMPPRGHPYKSQCCFVLTIIEGKIVHERDYIAPMT